MLCSLSVHESTRVARLCKEGEKGAADEKYDKKLSVWIYYNTATKDCPNSVPTSLEWFLESRAMFISPLSPVDSKHKMCRSPMSGITSRGVGVDPVPLSKL